MHRGNGRQSERPLSNGRERGAVHGKRRITADTALRLARFFGTSEGLWLNLQSRYDLEVERDRLGPDLEEQVEVLSLGSR